MLSIGEILVDIFVDGENKAVFPGGAPFNLACNIFHFEKNSSFYGAVGQDDYGTLLSNFAKEKMPNSLIDILTDKDTTQAVVTLDNGERSFKFVRANGADYHLDINRLKELDFNNINIVHIGSLMLSYLEGRTFYKEAIKYIHKNTKAMISFDINYRDDIFNNEQEAKDIFIEALKEADIIKFTEEELELLSGQKNVLDGLNSLLNEKQIAVITLGKDGSIFYRKNKYFIKVPSYPLKPVDTTGAGDAFYSYFLYSLDKGLDIDDEASIKNTLLRANVVGGLATQKKGAIEVVPNLEEIEAFIKSH